MIGYDIPLSFSGILFVLCLVLTGMHLLSALLADELVPGGRSLWFLRCYNGLLALIYAAVTFEWLLLIAAVEGGVFLAIHSWHRHLVWLLPVLFLYQCRYPLELPAMTRPESLSYFVTLLLLPVFARTPPILPLLLFVFTTVWLGLERAHFLLSYFRGSPMQTARSALPQLFYHIRQGLSIASSRGWILEANPAFYQACEDLGIRNPENVDQLEHELNQLCRQRLLRISKLPSGMTIYGDERVFMLQRHLFRADRKKFIQISLSDVTQVNLASQKLSEQNQDLEQRNLVLEKAIWQIEQEAMILERDRICRAAHDQWSQKMAVAGLSLDQLMSRNHPGDRSYVLEEISRMLGADSSEEVLMLNRSPDTMVRTLIEMYQKIGVRVLMYGQPRFTENEAAAVCSVIKEGLANAVRHAYARVIQITFFTEGAKTGIRIENECLDDPADVEPGRGLFDMEQRVTEAGGHLLYAKKQGFILQAVFSQADPVM